MEDLKNGGIESDPAADFLAREQSAFASLESENDFVRINSDNIAPTIMGDFEQNGSFDIMNSQPQENPVPVRDEPEKIKLWREEQKLILEKKDAEEAKKKEELREQAKQELKDWYRQHEETISKTKASNRNAEKQCVQLENEEIEPGTEWERIAKLCDFNPKASKSSKDVSRMRSIILQLKQNPQTQTLRKAS
ncbi:clathrin light chain [Condylostylus longicornis]|uniref:clathrin light chain n=1 Tax=Condylostylus longicornis TaxID=2530218 RepID=UPI00244E28DB|nr:clathrin light chain [Condylostylus longicornis]